MAVVNSCAGTGLRFAVHSFTPFSIAFLLAVTAPWGGFGADAQAPAIESTNTVLSADHVVGWDLDRCRAELATLEQDVRKMPDKIRAAKDATAAARKAATEGPQHQALVAEIAKLSRELETKRQELIKAVDDSPAVKQASEQERIQAARLESIHKSIAVAREQFRRQLAEKAAGKTDAIPARNP